MSEDDEIVPARADRFCERANGTERDRRVAMDVHAEIEAQAAKVADIPATEATVHAAVGRALKTWQPSGTREIGRAAAGERA